MLKNSLIILSSNIKKNHFFYSHLLRTILPTINELKQCLNHFQSYVIIYCMLACYADTGSKIKQGLHSISTCELPLDFSQTFSVQQCLTDQVVVPHGLSASSSTSAFWGHSQYLDLPLQTAAQLADPALRLKVNPFPRVWIYLVTSLTYILETLYASYYIELAGKVILTTIVNCVHSICLIMRRF